MKTDEIRRSFFDGRITKPEFIRIMFEQYHAKLFDYADYLRQTNIAAIEISDGQVVMTSRDRAIKMTCPPGDHRSAPIEILNFMTYESVDFDMILRLLTPESYVLDIGANIGWHALNIAKAYPSCIVHAFEPVPKTYSLLVQNVRLNQINNIVTHNLGLSDKKKDLTFFFYPEGSANASSANLSEREDIEKIVCPVETLDSCIKDLSLPRIDFIKCDVEGAELFVFRGGEKIIKRDKPIIFSEMLRKWSSKFNYHPNQIITLLSDLGYCCFTAKGKKLADFLSMNEETIETNFFFLHSTQHSKIIRSLTQ